ncbi:MAG: hypothetical protein RL514_1381 [Verrucomicrobiota bacterium]|jgi:hypothetical protein
MAFTSHSTAKPIRLAKETVDRVAENQRKILEESAESPERESTGNARYAVTKPAGIPPWSSR